MIASAMQLMGERGVDATSFSEVLAHSGAPRGSIYHHFPGGKAQLIEEATRFGGEIISTGLEAALEQEDPIAAVEGVAAFWRAALLGNEFALGCPVVAVTVEGGRVPAARNAAREVFKRWQDLDARILERAGVPAQRARSIAAMMVAAIEGAVILSRAERSDEPLERVVDELQKLIGDAVARGAGAPAQA